MLSYTLMDRIPLKAEDRTVLGKKVKNLRKDGLIPGHVFGNKTQVEHVSVNGIDFLKVFKVAGETGLVDLKIGEEKVRPVLIREIQHDPVKGGLLHVGFYAVNLKEKVKVPIPIVLVGEEPESVHMGEAVILQNIHEVEVEALPTDLVEHIEVDISPLKNIDDAILVSQLNYDREKLTVLAGEDEVVVKLDTAVTEEMKKLLEEQEAEAAAAAEAAVAEEGAEAPVEGEEALEGESASAQASEDGKSEGGEVTEGGESPETKKEGSEPAKE